MHLVSARLLWLGLMLLLADSVAGSDGVRARFPVFVEDSPVAQELVTEAHELRDSHRLSKAAAKYHQIIEFYAPKLIATGPHLYTAAPRWVCQALRADPLMLDAYRRIHAPQAEHALMNATLPRVDAAALGRVMQQYLLCPAGLEAGLRLAAWQLEQARCTDAASVLDVLADHPDLPAQRSRWHLLQAASGLFAGNAARVHAHREAVRCSEDVTAQDQLRQWEETTTLPTLVRSVDPLKTMPAAALPKPLGEPLWSLSIPTTAGQRSSARSSRTSSSSAIVGPRAMPLAHGDEIFVSDGQGVISIDRRSGRMAWMFPGPDHGQSLTTRQLERANKYVVDQRGPALDGNCIAAVLGLVTLWPGRGQQNDSQTWLVYLDRRDGRSIWQVQPVDLDDRFGSAFFHGTPVLKDGRVIVLLRRRTQTGGVQDAFVVALDGRTGQLRWKQHLSSTAGNSRYAPRKLTQILEHQGKLYIASQLGSVSCLDARTGTVIWLRLIPEDGNLMTRTRRKTRKELQPWQISPPVLVQAGLIVTPYANTKSALLLDSRTGQRLKELDSPEWAENAYVAAAGEDVLAIGPTVRLFDGQTLEERWSRSLGTAAVLYPAGRAAITANHVLIPTAQRLVILDLIDGSVVADPTIQSAGNVLVTDGQVTMASSQLITSYIDWDQAYPILVEAMRNSSADPRPGLALADAALKAGQTKAVLEGIDHALAVFHLSHSKVGVSPSLVFHRITGIVNSQQAANLQLRRSLLDRLASATAGPADEVTYQLTMAGFLEESGQFTKAVDHYQAILLDPTLSSQLYEDGPNMRQAALEVQVRLNRLIEKAGRSIYDQYERQAEQETLTLSRGSFGDPQQLIAVADHYPLARAALGARVVAAQMLAQSQAATAAMTQLQLAYRHCEDPDLLARIGGQMVELFESTGRTAQARRLLEKLHREQPDLMPLRHDQPVPVQTWLEDLAGSAGIAMSPERLTLPLRQPVTLQGQLCPPPAQASETGTSSYIVTVTEGAVQLYREPMVQPLWRQSRPTGPITLLSATDHDLILWDEHRGNLLALDPETGEELWPLIGSDAILDAETGRLVSRRGRGRGSLGFFVASNHSTICVGGNIDGGVRVVGIDRQQGRVLWRVRPPMHRLTAMHNTNDTVALAGRTGSGRATRFTLLVLDALTGEFRFTPLENQRRTQWLELNYGGMLFHASDRSLTARYVASGDIAWRFPMSPSALARPGRAIGDQLAIQESTGAVLLIDTRSGEVLNRRSSLNQDENRPLQILTDDDRWYFMSSSQAWSVDTTGHLVWRDALSDRSAQLLRLHLVDNRHVMLLSLVRRGDRRIRAKRDDRLLPPEDLLPAEPESERPARGGREEDGASGWLYRLYLLDRPTGRIVNQRDLGPMTEPIDAARATVLDNHLILSTATRTIVIPGS